MTLPKTPNRLRAEIDSVIFTAYRRDAMHALLKRVANMPPDKQIELDVVARVAPDIAVPAINVTMQAPDFPMEGGGYGKNEFGAYADGIAEYLRLNANDMVSFAAQYAATKAENALNDRRESIDELRRYVGGNPQ